MDRLDLEEDALSARRLFCATPLAQARQFVLGEAAAQHARVLRLTVGDRVELFDGRGTRVAARIERLAKTELCCSALGAPEFTPRALEVVLVQCLPKGKKLDDIVRMTSELGVATIHLARSERCVVQRSARDEHKVERLVRIAREAARQSEQAYVPEIMEPADLAQALARAPEGAFRAALTERDGRPLELPAQATSLWLVVGPEGGFSSRDREILSHAKFGSYSLGSAILRTETAAVVGVGLGIAALGRDR